MKTFNHDVSVRVKLKSNDLVEVVIMDHDTKEIFYYALNFRHSDVRPVCQSKNPNALNNNGFKMKPLPQKEGSELDEPDELVPGHSINSEHTEEGMDDDEDSDSSKNS